MKTYFNIKTFLAIVAIVVAACSGQSEQQTSSNNNQEEITPTKRPPVFSLFNNKERDRYQIYRNTDKLTSFSLTSGQYPLRMHSYHGDCYILVSRQIDSTGIKSAEILKNGKPAMSFDSLFSVTDFDMDNGHFYVLGSFGDTSIYVLRDGIKNLSIKRKPNHIPLKISIFKQDIFVAIQHNDSVEIYRNDKHEFSLPGRCSDMRASYMGIFTVAGDTVFRDKKSFMWRRKYQAFDTELLAAVPQMITLTNSNCYIGTTSTIDGEKTYTCIFRWQQNYTTTKPDDKPIGKSALSTTFAGITACGETEVYFASITLDEKMNPVIPREIHYFLNRDECFKIPLESADMQLFSMVAEE
jgi:hypothetical protein